MRPDETPYNRDAAAAFSSVEHAAFEKYILALVEGWGAEHDRLQEVHSERESPITVRAVELAGEYPDTVIRIRRYERARDKDDWYTVGLWKNPAFFDEEGNRLMSPEKMASDILTWSRGG